MYQKKLPPEELCPFEYTLSLFSGKWDTRILCLLAHNESMRFSQFKTMLSEISDTSLSNVMKKFMKNDIVIRESYNEIPPRVEYRLSERGKEIVPILQDLCVWSIKCNENPSLPKISLCEKCKYGITAK